MTPFEKIKELISEQFSVDPEELTLETSFSEDLNADSLDIVELIMALEEEYDTNIEDEEAGHIKTVGDAVEFIKQKLSQEGS